MSHWDVIDPVHYREYLDDHFYLDKLVSLIRIRLLAGQERTQIFSELQLLDEYTLSDLYLAYSSAILMQKYESEPNSF